MKADIKHYFENVDHEILLKIIERKINDDSLIWLIKQILNNLDTKIKCKGMPIGNLTSQFFANVYLNRLDYFVKNKLRAEFYIRYVDDFVILHENKEVLVLYKDKIAKYLKNLKLELHPDKSKILPLRSSITLLGYRIYYYHKLLRKSNLKKFEREFKNELELCKMGRRSQKEVLKSLQGWFGYSIWADTYKFRKNIIKKLNEKTIQKL